MDRRFLITTFAALASGCSSDPGPLDMPGDADDERQLTYYYEDVAPILVANCVGCHENGGIAPIPLETYEEAVAWGPALQWTTQERLMPPVLADASGSCNTFEHVRWLDQEEIDTIADWVADDMPPGDPDAAPARPSPPRGLDRVDRVLDTGAEFAPKLEDDYRCFVVDPDVDVEMFLTGYEAHPGNPVIDHHLILFALDTAEDSAQAQALDEADAEPGYPCFGGAGVPARFLAGWVPGIPQVEFPPGTGVSITANQKLVLQMHYHWEGGEHRDRTTVDLMLEPSVAKEAVFYPLAAHDLDLPPGMAHVEATRTEPVPESLGPLKVWGAGPHMHEIGKSVHVRAEGSASQCLVDIPRWDFNWQYMYFYKAPLTMMPGDTVSVTCAYDTTGRSEITTWGEGTKDEMCISYLYITP